jgi:hypothetical protein
MATKSTTPPVAQEQAVSVATPVVTKISVAQAERLVDQLKDAVKKTKKNGGIYTVQCDGVTFSVQHSFSANRR